MITAELMNKEHISEIAEIEKEAFGAENAEKTLLKELENKIAVYYAAVQDGKTAGYIGIWNICGEAEVINIAVRPEKRRQGIGSFLLKTVFDYCIENNVSSLNLEVRESNQAARALYASLGFETAGERKKYYDGTETAVLMKKDFI